MIVPWVLGFGFRVHLLSVCILVNDWRAMRRRLVRRQTAFLCALLAGGACRNASQCSTCVSRLCKG